MAFIYSALTVANIAEAKALNATSKIKRVDGLFLAIADTGSGFPGWYRYSANSTLAENLPKVFKPTDDVGAWLQFGGDDEEGGGGAIAPLTVLRLTDSPYTATFGQRLLICGGSTSNPLIIQLPDSPVFGSEIEIISGGCVSEIYVGSGGNNFPPNNTLAIDHWIVGNYLGNYFNGGKLIYGNDGSRNTWIAYPAPTDNTGGNFGYST